MKKLTCLLLSFIIFSTQLLAQNPCEDKLYIELKNQLLLDETKIETMTQREYEYFMQTHKACQEYEAQWSRDYDSKKKKEKSDEDFNDTLYYIIMALLLTAISFGYL